MAYVQMTTKANLTDSPLSSLTRADGNFHSELSSLERFALLNAEDNGQ